MSRVQEILPHLMLIPRFLKKSFRSLVEGISDISGMEKICLWDRAGTFHWLPVYPSKSPYKYEGHSFIPHDSLLPSPLHLPNSISSPLYTFPPNPSRAFKRPELFNWHPQTMLAIPQFSGISPLLSILLASSILCHFAEAYGAMRFGYGGLEQQRRQDIWRPTTEINPQWKLRQWQTVDARDTRGPYKMLRSTRSVNPSESESDVVSVDADSLAVPLSPSELTTPQKPVSPATEWAPLFNEEENAEDESARLLKNLAQNDDEEPLVFSRYNRDCFFTPINCLVGRARQQAANIVGSASNSKRQILFIKRRQHHHKKQKRQRNGNNRHKKSRNIYLL